jgi:hypothetical protein
VSRWFRGKVLKQPVTEYKQLGAEEEESEVAAARREARLEVAEGLRANPAANPDSAANWLMQSLKEHGYGEDNQLRRAIHDHRRAQRGGSKRRESDAESFAAFAVLTPRSGAAPTSLGRSMSRIDLTDSFHQPAGVGRSASMGTRSHDPRAASNSAGLNDDDEPIQLREIDDEDAWEQGMDVESADSANYVSGRPTLKVPQPAGAIESRAKTFAQMKFHTKPAQPASTTLDEADGYEEPLGGDPTRTYRGATSRSSVRGQYHNFQADPAARRASFALHAERLTASQAVARRQEVTLANFTAVTSTPSHRRAPHPTSGRGPASTSSEGSPNSPGNRVGNAIDYDML